MYGKCFSNNDYFNKKYKKKTLSSFLSYSGKYTVSHHDQREYLNELHVKVESKYWIKGRCKKCKNKITSKE